MLTDVAMQVVECVAKLCVPLFRFGWLGFLHRVTTDQEAMDICWQMCCDLLQ